MRAAAQARSRRAAPLSLSSGTIASQQPARWVQVDDSELVRRLEHLRASREHSGVLSQQELASGEWKWECNKKGFSIYSRRRSSSTDSEHNNQLEDGIDGEVAATGTVEASMDKLAALFRSGSESDYNSRMKALYKSQFIYGSLVHVVAFADRIARVLAACHAEQCRIDTPPDAGARQVVVKTCAFARPRSLSMLTARNEQWCYAEQFRRTPQGFAVEFTSLDASDISLGKARPGCVDELKPFSGWLSVEQTSPSLPLRVLFRAQIEQRPVRDRLARQCSIKTTLARLIQIATGMSRLGDAVAAKPAPTLSEKSHGNSHCISCTSKLRLTYRLAGRQRQCQLCFYAACSDCCRREQLLIYNRYKATLEVCHRCKESMHGGEYSHLQLVASKRHGSHGSLSLFSGSDRGMHGVDARTLSAAALNA